MIFLMSVTKKEIVFENITIFLWVPSSFTKLSQISFYHSAYLFYTNTTKHIQPEIQCQRTNTERVLKHTHAI